MELDRRLDDRDAAPLIPLPLDASGPPAPVLQALGVLYAHLPPQALTGAQRRRTASSLVADAPRLVRGVAALLARHGAELPEAGEDPRSLAAQQDHSDELRFLRAHLQQLYTQANDAYLLTQAQAVTRARAVVRRVHSASTFGPRPTDPGPLLRQALLGRVRPFDPRSPRRRARP